MSWTEMMLKQVAILDGQILMARPDYKETLEKNPVFPMVKDAKPTKKETDGSNKNC